MADTDAEQQDAAWCAAVENTRQPVGAEDKTDAASEPTEWSVITPKTLAEAFEFLAAQKPHIVFSKHWDSCNESK
jgi:hypothetical protein